MPGRKALQEPGLGDVGFDHQAGEVDDLRDGHGIADAADLLPWDGRGFEFTGLLVNLLMLQSWGFYDEIVWNRPSWSISLEWFVYLLFPLFVMLFGRIHRSRSLLLSIAVLFAAYYLGRYGIWHFARANIGPAALMRVTFGFLMGFFLYGLFRRRFLARLPWDAICLATIAAFIAMMLMNGTVSKFDYSLNFPIALLVLAAANSTGFAARLFDNRLSLYLGEISYSIYMVHFPFLRFCTYNFGDDIAGFAATAPQWQLWLMVACVLAALIAVSALCYHTIEVPCRDFVKRRVRAHEARGAA
jgi:peptidoglycan/LPS O-acetylase OafA/YrhL